MPIWSEGERGGWWKKAQLMCVFVFFVFFFSEKKPTNSSRDCEGSGVFFFGQLQVGGVFQKTGWAIN